MCDPDVKNYRLQNDDKFIVAASDGLWDVMNDQDAVDVAQVRSYGKLLIVNMSQQSMHPFLAAAYGDRPHLYLLNPEDGHMCKNHYPGSVHVQYCTSQ